MLYQKKKSVFTLLQSSLSLPSSFSLPPLSSTPQARLQRANTLLRLGKIDEAAGDFQVLSDTASGTVKEDAQVQVCIHVVFTGMPCSLFLMAKSSTCIPYIED